MNHQDGYKITMAFAAHMNFGDLHTARFAFRSRGPEKLGVLAEDLRRAWWLNGHTTASAVPLSIDQESLEYIQSFGVSEDYANELRQVHQYRSRFDIDTVGGDLKLGVRGLWGHVTHFEIPVLGEVQELWTMHKGWNHPDIIEEGKRRLTEKIKLYNTIPRGCCSFIEMGTRRAFTRSWGAYVIGRLAKELKHFGGTSNVGLAKELGVRCGRTMAHEWLQAGQVLSGNLSCSQYIMLSAWLRTFPAQVNVALTDCLGLDVFLREFNRDLTRGYGGTRQDSGKPEVYGDKMLAHYDNNGVDPKTKIACFSNRVTPELVFSMLDRYNGKFKRLDFGSGKDFAHDMGDPVVPLNIVMKLVELDGKPVAKISDDEGKGMCEDAAYVHRLKKANGIS